MNKQEILQIAREKGTADAGELRTEAAAGAVTQTEIIDREIAVPAWQKKDYSAWPVNSPLADGGQVWLLLQPHDARNYEGRPADLRALWGLAHTKNPAKAKPFVTPYGTSGLYMQGECCTDDAAEPGVIYMANRDNVNFAPHEYAADWTIVETEVVI